MKHMPAIREVLIHEVNGRHLLKADDVAVEEPLEIVIAGEKPICVTMRTPGEDAELALGYLFAEGVIRGIDDITNIIEDPQRVTIGLRESAGEKIRRLQRNVFTSSSCGICSAPSLDSIKHAQCPDLPRAWPIVGAGTIHKLPGALKEQQAAFARTGGLHAAALFDLYGNLLRLREDVGRHNALDKLIGSCVREGLIPLAEHVVLVSGRTSYELVQKTLMAGVPVLAAVGAPSSLAIELAQAHGLTLIGFVREERFNVYHGEERLVVD